MTENEESKMSDIKDAAEVFEEALAKADKGKYVLFLFVRKWAPDRYRR
jgi:hypothetical protein